MTQSEEPATASIRPRRSVLYMPGANARALDKARELACDAIIFDLEDAVAADAKSLARDQVVATVSRGGYGYRELVVRVNGLDTPWGVEDVQAVAGLPLQGLLFPKVETAAQIDHLLEVVDEAGGHRLPLWFMVETPQGVLDIRDLARRTSRLSCLVMGTSDLVKELRALHTDSRLNIAYALQHCVLAARACGVEILDGVHLDFRNQDSFRTACETARAMGYDGKTLIHPTQIDLANEIFGYDAEAVDQARAVLAAWEAAQAQGKGVAVLDGKLIENLHAAEARRTLAFAQELADR